MKCGPCVQRGERDVAAARLEAGSREGPPMVRVRPRGRCSGVQLEISPSGKVGPRGRCSGVRRKFHPVVRSLEIVEVLRMRN